MRREKKLNPVFCIYILFTFLALEKKFVPYPRIWKQKMRYSTPDNLDALFYAMTADYIYGSGCLHVIFLTFMVCIMVMSHIKKNYSSENTEFCNDISQNDI